MSINPARELARLRRRVSFALFWEGFATAALAIAATGGGVLIAARLFGAYLAPSPFWALALLPAAACGVLLARLRGFGWRAAAIEVDRRFGLGGLLVTGLETETGAWSDELARRLATSEAAQPRFAPGRWAARFGLAAAFAALLCALPEPEPEHVRSTRMLELALEDVTEDIELALEDGVVSEARGQELERRAKNLRRRLDEGEQVSWADVDVLAERLSQEQSSHVGGLQSLRAGFRDLDAARGLEGERDAPESARMHELWQRAADLGLLEDMLEQLPDELRQELERAAREAANGLPEGLEVGRDAGLEELLGKLDPRDLGLDPETMQRLFDGLGDGAEGSLRKLAMKGRVPKGQLRDLEAMLESEGLLAKGKGKGRGKGKGKRKGRTDAWGIDRGPGEADLLFERETDADTSGLAPKRLPPGAAVPDEWQVAGVSRAAPVADPQAGTAGGAGGDVQGTGRATWRRRLAPRHREAVRRFFSDRR